MTLGGARIGMVVIGGLALLITSCASDKTKLNASTMCQANGGTYDTGAQTCSYMASTRSARQICEAHGGYYNQGGQVCEVGRE